jgi:hypothetical protein
LQGWALHFPTTTLQRGYLQMPVTHDRITSLPRACRGGQAAAAESEDTMQGYVVAAHVAACPTPRPRGAPSAAGVWLCATWEVGAFCVADLLPREVVRRWPRRSPASEVVAGRRWPRRSPAFSRCSSSVFPPRTHKYLRNSSSCAATERFPPI